MTPFLGIGIGIGVGLGRARWWESGTLLDADYENGLYYFNGQTYSSVAALAAAMGGTNSGNVLSIGPHLTGDILYQSDFSSGIDGWADVGGYEAAGEPSSVGGNLRLITSANYRAFKSIAVASAKAALCSGTIVAESGATSKVLTAGNNTSSANGTVSTSNFSGTPPQSRSVLACSSPTALFLRLDSVTAGQIDWSEVSALEAIPYDGYLQEQVRFEFDVTFPAAAAGNKVIAQWGAADEDYRVRLVWDASAVLRMIITYGNTEQANLNLGTVTVGTRHTIKGSAAASAFYASLDGGTVSSDTSGTMPAVGLFWLGRSVTGETFDGTIHRAKVWANAVSDPNELVDPTLAFRIYGDSTANGDGSTTDWYQNLTAAYTPDRAYAKNAAGGETSAQMLARVAADTAVYRDWTTIFMDRPNTGESSADWIANVKAAVAYLQTDRWYVHPPVQDVPDTSIANITEVQAALLSDPFFGGHTLGAVEQAAYITEMADGATRSDGVHDSDAGAVVRATYIKAFMDAASW